MRTQPLLLAELYYTAIIPRHSSLSNLGTSTASITAGCRTSHPRGTEQLSHMRCPSEDRMASTGCRMLLSEPATTEKQSKGNRSAGPARMPILSPALLRPHQHCHKWTLHIPELLFSLQRVRVPGSTQEANFLPEGPQLSLDVVAIPAHKVVKDLTPKSPACLAPHSWTLPFISFRGTGGVTGFKPRCSYLHLKRHSSPTNKRQPSIINPRSY